MRKSIFTFIMIVLWAISSEAQNKSGIKFTMPSGAAYSRGRVLVKVRSEYKNQLMSLLNSVSARVKDLPVSRVGQIATPEMIQHASLKAKERAAAPVVDISNYFSISFDQAKNVEEYINKLYATGYFEIVEPEYMMKSDFTPNDPLLSSQYYLGVINAFKAWDINQGDTTVVIAIVDTGGNLNHADLKPNLFKNKWDPVNGIDDDGNGFIDDYQGWDFIGADTMNIYQSDYTPQKYGDRDPSINPNPPVSNAGDLNHGTWVAGCAGASANNGIGIAGVGFKTKLMFTKHTGDNQNVTKGTEYATLLGMMYAADLFHRHGIRGIINCSFGGSGQSQIVQDIINSIVLDQNCLIIASAGNSGISAPSYPAAYNNVISVAATDQNDVAPRFTNYGTTIDLSAPGVGIYTTQYNNTYTTATNGGTVDGTSFSAPITSGAAALVWAQNPSFSAVQVGEQLRVTANASALYTANPGRINQLGLGRLDVYRALTLSLPSIRASNPKLVNANGIAPASGDKAYLSFSFNNKLQSTSAGIKISITTSSSFITITQGTISPGVIAGGATFINSLTPFVFTISPNTPQDLQVNLLITYSDGSYSDYQYVPFVFNPSYIDINSNKITTTITSIGRMGYEDTQNQAKGSGFVFNQNSLLYEMGLIMGTSATNLFNNVRGMNGGFDQDFSSTVSIKQTQPGARSYSEIFGEISNAATPAQQQVVVDYRSLVWQDSVYNKFVIVEYKIKNPTANPLNQFYFGIFADWDVSPSGQHDKAGWDNTNNMGYVHSAQATPAKPYAGIQVLTGSPAYYAIDNNSSIAGNPWGLYSNTANGSFTKVEKYQTISATIGSAGARLKAGVLPAYSGAGGDVSHVVATGPFNISAGQTITVAFALQAAPDSISLKKSARYADSVYNYTLKAPKPTGDSVATCYQAPATFNVSGATKINWYKSFTGGTPFFTGTNYTTGNLQHDTTFFVSNADHSYESVRAAVKATVKANPKILASKATTLCQGDSVLLSVAKDDSTIWNTGNKNNIISVKTTGKYAVRIKDNALGCSTRSDTVSVVVRPGPAANFSTTGDLKIYTPISFNDQSTNAVSWYWDFGDNQNSTTESPTHQYTAIQNYTVKLTATAANGCTNTKLSSISVVTAIENFTHGFSTYPNPVTSSSLNIVIDEQDLSQTRLLLFNSLGQIVYDQNISVEGTHAEISLPFSSFPPGVYILRVQVPNKILTEKVIKAQ
ncbi:MAG: S8 family serine peptidase [Bacteroidetes bacterium]|nr:S8 family serine peptidase [Bacteroidota bacterium]MBS1540598.1 S8 family serine peptidase [Bacteroidota bacterium]